MEEMISVCGVNCSKDCPLFMKKCEGCRAINGKVFWAYGDGVEKCPLFDCAEKKGFFSCGFCREKPCEIWMSTRDPDLSDEEFEKDVRDRIKRLDEFCT